jgi:hypothetical protein
VSTGQDRRPTKAERKEQARAERQEIERKQAARRRNRIFWIVGAVVVVALIAGAAVAFGGDNGSPTDSASSSTALPPDSLPGIMKTPPPWPNNLQDANERLAKLGLPTLSDTAGIHYHIRLWLYVDGQPVVLPSSIGYSPGDPSYKGAVVLSPLHTHDSEQDNTIHVESADANFQPLLGQFMDVWGLYFTPTCLGDRCNDGDQQLRVFVNGEPYVGDPTLLPLNDQSAVVITFGTEAQLPDPMPDSFTFNTNG